MPTVRIKYRNLIRQLLPAHKRQPVRLEWLRGLTAPLSGLFASFDKWRDQTRMMLNVTGQVKVLEGYLRRIFGNLSNIRINTFIDGLCRISLREEGDALRLRTGMRPETSRSAVPLRGELRQQFEGVDFIIYIPSEADTEAVRVQVERIRQALATYKIIQE